MSSIFESHMPGGCMGCKCADDNSGDWSLQHSADDVHNYGRLRSNFYYTTDGSNPSTSSNQYTMPFSIGTTATIKAIAYIAPNSSPVTTANIQSDPNTLPVPRTGLSLWLKNDFGPILSGSNVTTWSDLSGSVPSNDCTQSITAKQPTLVTGAINGYSTVNFNSSNSQYFAMTSGLSNLTSGFSIFAVLKPSGTGTATLLTTGNSGPADLTSLQTLNTKAQFNAYNGTTASSVSTGTGALSTSNFQLLSAIHNGSGSASIFVNSVNQATGTVQNLNNVSRAQNYVGANNTLASFWNGQLSELLVYSRGVTTSEQASIEAYLYSRYQLGTAIATPTPILSVPTSTLSAPQNVAISAIPGATIHFTLDGTTPGPGSPTYTAPVNISFTQTLKAIAIANGISSSVASATYTLDSTQWPAPSATDTRPLQLNLQLPTTAIPQ